MKQTLWNYGKKWDAQIGWIRGPCWDARITEPDYGLMEKARKLFNKLRTSKHHNKAQSKRLFNKTVKRRNQRFTRRTGK